MKKKVNTLKAHHVRFLFDPACPWAWKTSLWVRAASRVRPLTIEWDLLSLEYINREEKDNPYKNLMQRSRLALRLLAKAREVAGDEGIDRLYLLLGDAHHNHGRDLDDEDMLTEALIQANLPVFLLEKTRKNEALDPALEAAYERDCARGAFGVPTLYIDHNEIPYFGPVIDRVPPDEAAGELWDHILGISQHSYFYELKRLRM